MEQLERKKIQIKTLSPVHIKGKDIEYGQGFVRRDSVSAYAIDADKLSEYLYDLKGNFSLVNEYANEIENNPRDFNNTEFFKKHGIFWYENNRQNEKELIEKGVFKTIVNATTETNFIRNGLGKPFIPGSSLKGAIRTAIMYNIAKKMIQKKRGIKEVIDFMQNISLKIDEFEKRYSEKNDRQKELGKAKFSQELQFHIFQGQSRFSAQKDFMRSLKIKDSQPLTSLAENRVVLLSLTSKEKKNNYENKKKEIAAIGDVGNIINVGEGVAVEINGKIFEFTNKVYKNRFDELKRNVGKKILIIDAAGNKVKDFDILSKTSQTRVNNKDNINQTPKERYLINYKLKPSGEPTDFSIETFSGTTELLITLDLFILKKRKSEIKNIPFSNIDDIMQLVAEFGKDLWGFEKNFWDRCTDDILDVSAIRDFYSAEPGNVMRIGWGTGLMGMTINMLLKDKQLRELRNRLFTDRGNMPAPKSRRVIEKDNMIDKPLGWVKFDV